MFRGDPLPHVEMPVGPGGILAAVSSSTSGVGSTSPSSTVNIADGLTDMRFRQAFEEMRLSGEMCDVTIKVEDSEFRAHKLILAGCAPYFGAMFRGNNFDESHSQKIHIDPNRDLGIRAEAVEQLIDYIYTGRISINQGNVIDLIRAADLLELSSIKSKTLKVIEEHITFETYLDIRDVGNVYNCPRLLVAVDKFIHRHFDEFMKIPSFFDLPETELVQYLKNDHLRTETEEDIFDGALEWCKRKDKLDKFPEIGQHIRFQLISIKHVLKSMKDDPSLKANAEVTNFLLDKLHWMAGSLQHVATSRPRFSTRVLVAMPFGSRNFYVITFHGGDNIEFAVNHFPAPINEHVEGHANFTVCRVGHGSLMYLAGSGMYAEEVLPYTRGLVYDVLKDTWCISQPLPRGFSNFCMAAVGNKVYVLTGDGSVFVSSDPIACIDVTCDHHHNLDHDTQEALYHENQRRIIEGSSGPPEDWLDVLDREVVAANSINPERFWMPVSRMNYARTSVHLVGIGRKLYALGGMLDGGFTSLVEMYDADADVWTDVDSMGEARCNPGVAVAGGKIYVAGGVGDNLIGPPGALKTVEYYDPESDTWSHLPDMYFPRFSPAVAHVNNKLFVFGGGSPSQMAGPGPETTIECFDFERHEWFVLQTKIPGTSDAYYVGAFFDYLET